MMDYRPRIGKAHFHKCPMDNERFECLNFNCVHGESINSFGPLCHACYKKVSESDHVPRPNEAVWQYSHFGKLMKV